MPGLVPGIHVLLAATKTWMAGTNPAMTALRSICRAFRALKRHVDCETLAQNTAEHGR
jgi:hypothetical protein